MKQSKNRQQIFENVMKAIVIVFCIIVFFICALCGFLYIKYLPEIKLNKIKDSYKQQIMLLAEKGEPFTLAQAISDTQLDEAKLITNQYDTGFGENENDDYYCKVKCTNNWSNNILVLFKDKKHVFDFTFDKYDNFTFADSFETLSADTLLTATKQDGSDGYILSIK